MTANTSDMATIAAIQNKYSEMLFSYPYVLGLGIGFRQRSGFTSDELCLVVMVKRKLPQEQLPVKDRLPRELEGVALDVIESGDLSARCG